MVILTQQENPKLGNRPSVSTPLAPRPFAQALPRASFSFSVDPQPRDGQMVVAYSGKDEGLVSRTPGANRRPPPIVVGGRKIHLAIRNVPSSAGSGTLLLFPRLGEINSRCLRVLATGRRSCSFYGSFDPVLLFISVH